MRTKFVTSIFLFFLFSPAFALSSLETILTELDEIIHDNNKIHNKEKELRIKLLKERAELITWDSADEYELNQQLYQEYKTYICDSAIHYLNKNVILAQQLYDTTKENKSVLQLAYLMGSTGMYKEAVDFLSTINRDLLMDSELVDYYAAYDHVYGELAYYTQDELSSARYYKISANYKDSLIKVLPKNSALRLVMDETAFRDANNISAALEINDRRLASIKPGTPEYAMATFHRALAYRQQGDVESEKYYLALSALSDIQSAIKDHASLWMLAQLLFEQGHIERAYNYIRFSWNETVFYNARLRSLQSANILSLIDKTYQAMIEKQNMKLQVYLISISILSLLLLVAFIFIYKQMHRLSTARSNLQNANNQLKKLNEELKEVNEQLKLTNYDLTESNQIKEKYIGRFIKLCSVYIDKLDAYRRMVNKRITAGQVNELLKATKSPEMLDEEIKELFVNFDTAFLQLFPDFVKKFNELLDEPIVLKKGELLNIELRIFALIRIGIDDSSQIAEFLRYSVNTIYNYRAKVKNKAKVSRDDFENIVKKIR